VGREHTTGDPAVTVVDSGVAIDHPDLAANVWRNTWCKPVRIDGLALGR
jgi:subtilisin family serine protease